MRVDDECKCIDTCVYPMIYIMLISIGFIWSLLKLSSNSKVLNRISNRWLIMYLEGELIIWRRDTEENIADYWR